MNLTAILCQPNGKTSDKALLIRRLQNSADDTIFPQAKREEIVEAYFATDDHGYNHSVNVWHKCCEIIEAYPYFLERNGWKKEYSHCVLFWACLLHDFSRFVPGVTFHSHEKQSAEIARAMFEDEDVNFAYDLYNAIIHHDYFCPEIDGYEMPGELKNPVSEILRLADKTHSSPEEETQRYWDTGMRYNQPIYNPSLTDEERLDFQGDRKNWDIVNWFIYLFILQPEHFHFPEMQEVYRKWALQKHGRVCGKIYELLLCQHDINDRPINLEEVQKTFDRLIQKITNPA